MKPLDLSQELKELGLRGAAFRAAWEIQGRLGIRQISSTAEINTRPYTDSQALRDLQWSRNLTFGDAPSVAATIRPLVDPSQLQQLRERAQSALAGEILCFSNSAIPFGRPIDWHLQPATGAHWDRTKDLTFSISGDCAEGDVKLTWEVGRFPHAYHISRAAAFFPEMTDALGDGLLQQLELFQDGNPFGNGVHWSSGQEISFRLLAWLFAMDALFSRTQHRGRAERLIADAMIAGATWIEAHLNYSRVAVYNNHLLSEAVALFGVGAMLPLAQDSPRWRQLGRQILDEESARQFYADGGYIQQSHNYHRVALQDLLWACAFARAMGDRPSPCWISAMERSLDFLVAHQNPTDGRLPNYGANDGSCPSILSCCSFSDMRPTLQALSILVRNERLYDPGPWDEAAAWWLGPMALDAPKRNFARKSVSVPYSGYHVLRGADESNFVAFRCGSLHDRFSQIDMLHLDVWWRGQNVLVDAGSFQYNAAAEWHNHFMRTGCHNTVEIDGLDQMVHFRQFKVLYWTHASLLDFKDHGNWAIVEGEHYGYRRQASSIHRRTVIFLKDDVWIVVDTIRGIGRHRVRLNWLAGIGECTPLPTQNGWILHTPQGHFSVQVLDGLGRTVAGDSVAGQSNPPRGWLSRFYGDKVAVPSFAATQTDTLPVTFVTVLSGVPVDVMAGPDEWTIRTANVSSRFELSEDRLSNVRVS